MRRKREERRRRRRLTFRTIFMLSLTLIFNTYAWFLYVTTVSTNMQVHVDAWSVNFEVDSQTVEREFDFVISHAYPGMEDISRTVTISNSGEKIADISYSIASLRILEDVYIVRSELSTTEIAALTGDETEVTATEMARMIAEDYPFLITITADTAQLAVGGSGAITMGFEWDYESGDDDLDTQYGVDSYNYYQSNTGSPAIEVKIKIKAQQHRT